MENKKCFVLLDRSPRPKLDRPVFLISKGRCQKIEKLLASYHSLSTVHFFSGFVIVDVIANNPIDIINIKHIDLCDASLRGWLFLD